MSKEINKDAPKPELTPEQLKKRREDITKNYKDQIAVLTHQLEYENLLANIEQARAKRMEMVIRQAQMSAPPEEVLEEEVLERNPVDPQEVAPSEEKKERKLKVN
jgi:hypothetical protein